MSTSEVSIVLAFIVLSHPFHFDQFLTLRVELQGGIKIDLSQRQSVKFKDKMGI
jgi:hypothetical protein